MPHATKIIKYRFHDFTKYTKPDKLIILVLIYMQFMAGIIILEKHLLHKKCLLLNTRKKRNELLIYVDYTTKIESDVHRSFQ